MNAARKFLFDTSFDTGRPESKKEEEPVAPVEVVEKAPPPAPTFGKAELAAARREGEAAGRAAAAAESQASLEQSIATALETANRQIETLLADQAAAAETRRAVALRLSIKAIETLFSSLAGSTRLAEIESTIDTTLRQLEDEPRVVIRVADDLVDPLRERLEALTRAARFDGQLMLLPDDLLGPGAVRIEWASGGAERDSALLWQEMRATIEGHLASLPEIGEAGMEAEADNETSDPAMPDAAATTAEPRVPDPSGSEPDLREG